MYKKGSDSCLFKSTYESTRRVEINTSVLIGKGSGEQSNSDSNLPFSPKLIFHLPLDFFIAWNVWNGANLTPSAKIGCWL